MAGMTASNPSIVELPEVELPGSGSGESWIVTVYNNDHNSIDEVMLILMIATQCDTEEAYMETWEVHNLGKSVVHRASEGECQNVAGVIATIGIQVEVSPEWND